MRKILATISTLAFALTLSASVAAAANPAAPKVLTCPVNLSTWNGTFYAGAQGMCSYYTMLSDEDKIIFKSAGVFNNLGILASLPYDVWEAKFLAEDWNGGKFNLYNLEK